MRTTQVAATAVLATVLSLASSVSAWAQSEQSVLIEGYAVARDIPDAHELPDPNTEYKVAFSVAQAASAPNEVNPMLGAIARYVNTLAKYGVPEEHRKIAVVFHQGGTDIVMNNDAYRERYDGQDNPNISLIEALSEAGVDFRVCGQALTGRNIESTAVQPQIQIDLWAMTTIINLQTRGYVRIGG